jgi:hypothetical protein
MLSLNIRSLLGRMLTWAEVDANWTAIQTAVNGLLAATPGLSIASITQPTSNTLLITFSDASTAAFTLPMGSYNYRGAWAPTTAYAVNDTFQINGTLYAVIWAHTSASTFVAGANDGAGHDYYQALLGSPSNALPTGGTTGQALVKNSNTDFDVVWATIAAALANISGLGAGVKTALAAVANATGGFLTLGGTFDLPVANLDGGSGATGSTFWRGDGTWADPLPAATTDGYVLTLASGLPVWAAGGGGGGAPTYNGSWSGTLALGDAWSLIDVNTSGTTTITVPDNSTTAFPIGSQIFFVLSQTNAAASFAAASGVTVTPPAGKALTASQPGSIVWLVKVAANTWDLLGDLDHALGTASASTGTATFDRQTQGDVIEVTPTGTLDISPSRCHVGEVTIVIKTSGTTSYTVTFSGYLHASGTLATGTVSGKTFVIVFKGDGTNYYEASRSGALS